MSEKLIDNVELRVTSPVQLGGLDKALAKLNAINAAITKLQGNLAGLDTGSVFRRGAATLTAALNTRKGATSGAQRLDTVARALGFGNYTKDIQFFRDRLRDDKRKIFNELFTDVGGNTLKNPTAAGKFLRKYSLDALERRRAGGVDALTISQLLGGTSTGGIPRSAVSAAAAAGGGSSGGSGGGKFSVARQQVLNELTKNLQGAVGDPKRMALVQRKAASQLEALASQYKLSELQQARLDGRVGELRLQAEKSLARARAQQTGTQRNSAALAGSTAAALSAAGSTAAQRRVALQRSSAALADRQQAAVEKSQRRQEDKRRAEMERAERFRVRVQRASAALEARRQAAVRPPPLPVTPRIPPSKPGALSGFAPLQFGANIAKVTSWAAAVGVLYKGVDLVNSSMTTLIEKSAQMARLDQVFSKVGGTTRDLTDDVLALAAAEGRSGDEALQSAISWSRLGFSRAGVNEAVRTSLVAANVAEISAADATTKLQAIMAAYGLEVGQVSGVLGQLNAVSNVYNTTVGGMLEGLTRTASVAKQAGLPLSELIGILGATIGQTGQTGANIGNAIKSITVALSNPVLQENLRNNFNIEVTKDGGEDIKSMSQILAELRERYVAMNDAQRQSLLFMVAGKTQASRLAAVLDSYHKAQELVVTAQKNMNSAEIENAKIKATLKSRIEGLKTEWERFITMTGTAGTDGGGTSIVGAISEGVLGMRNMLLLTNELEKAMGKMGSEAKFAFTSLNQIQMGQTLPGPAGALLQYLPMLRLLNAGVGAAFEKKPSASGLKDKVKSGALGEDEPGSESFLARTQKITDFHEKTKTQLEAISALYRDMPVNGAVQAAEREMDMLRQQVKLLEIKRSLVTTAGGTTQSTEEERNAIVKQKAELQGQIKAIEGARQFNQMRDRLAFGVQMGGVDATRGDFGIDPSDRLRNRQRNINEQMGRIRSDPKNLTDAVQIGRLMELQNRWLETRLQMKEREAEIDRDINQLLSERNREFQKSLLGAGPSELLRKMAAQMFNRKGVTGAGFMAMSPELRGDVAMLDPRFDPRMMDLQAEKRRGPKIPGAEAELKNIGDIKALTDGLGAALIPAGAMLNEAAAGMKEFATAATAAMNNLANLEVLSQLPAIVARVVSATTGVGVGAAVPVLPAAGGLQAGRPALP